MIEYNGWISLLNRTDGEGDIESLKKSISRISDLIVGYNEIINQSFEIKLFNGSYVLFVGGNHNHDSDYSNDLLFLLKKIANITPGSYGVIYIRLPEDGADYNTFKIYKLAKSKAVSYTHLTLPTTPYV